MEFQKVKVCMKMKVKVKVHELLAINFYRLLYSIEKSYKKNGWIKMAKMPLADQCSYRA